MLSNIKRLMGHKPLYPQEMADEAARIPGTDRYDVKDSTRSRYGTAGSLIAEYFGQAVDVTSITRNDYATFHDWIATRGTRIVTVNTYRRLCRAVWNRLSQRNWPVCDIAGITKMEPIPTPDGKAIADDHLNWLLNIANVRDLAMVLFAAQSGCRRQTLARIKVSETRIWEGPDGRWRIASKIPSEKGGRPRPLFAGHEAALAVMLWLEIRRFESDYLFNSMTTGDPLNAGGVDAIMRNLRERSNLPGGANVGWHALRHRFAQRQLSHHDAKVVADWMGISVETVLLVYAQRTNEELEAIYFGDDAP